MYAITWMNLRNIIQAKEGLHKIIPMVYFLLHNILVEVKFNYGGKRHKSDCLWGEDGQNSLGRDTRELSWDDNVTSLEVGLHYTSVYICHIMAHSQFVHFPV